VVEDRLPPDLMARAMHGGPEFIWRPADFPDAISAVERVGGVGRSVVAQFRTPDGTLEPVRTQRDLGVRPRGETENAYAARSIGWARAAFDDLMREDFADIVRRQPSFLDHLAPENAVAEHLGFILSLSEPDEYL
jgi:hypothetical protein